MLLQHAALGERWSLGAVIAGIGRVGAAASIPNSTSNASSPVAA